jgi:heme/copper-type cytochrome/quinol oxidase subunit 4
LGKRKLKMAKKKKQEKVKELPLGVKIIAMWYYAIYSAFIIVLLMIIILMPAHKILLSEISITWILTLIFIIALDGLLIFVGISLWKGKNWARVSIITLSSLIIIFLAYIIFNAIEASLRDDAILYAFGICINAFVIAYLLFSNEVREAFRK